MELFVQSSRFALGSRYLEIVKNLKSFARTVFARLARHLSQIRDTRDPTLLSNLANVNRVYVNTQIHTHTRTRATQHTMILIGCNHAGWTLMPFDLIAFGSGSAGGGDDIMSST